MIPRTVAVIDLGLYPVNESTRHGASAKETVPFPSMPCRSQFCGLFALPALHLRLLLIVIFIHKSPCRTTFTAKLPRPATRDITATQLIGTYKNVPLPTPPVSSASGNVCPDFFRVERVEFLQTEVAALYILPHRFQSLPIEGGGVAKCVSSPIDDSAFTTESATILRREDQQRLDRNISIINKFAEANERFFLGFELGPRRCGSTELQAGSVSMWVAPEKSMWIRVTSWGFDVNFAPPRKYVVFFDDVYPCVFEGDASEKGVVTEASSPTPSVTASVSPSASASTSPTPSPSTVPFVPSPFRPAGGALPISPVATYGGSDPVCFPGHAVVLRPYPHLSVSIASLRPGMTVHIDHHSPPCTVVGFSHRDANARTLMLRIRTDTNQTLSVSPGHYVYVVHPSHVSPSSSVLSPVAVKANAVQIGDRMLMASLDSDHSKQSALATVTATDFVWETGLYNPQTTCGDIVVDGFLVTTYTNAVGGFQVGHALMTPLRAITPWINTNFLLDRVSETVRSFIVR